MKKPSIKPQNPNFSSGPCAKRPGWSFKNLEHALLGRSHRSSAGKERLKRVIEEQRRLLNLPDDYRLGIVPASDTGAIEMAMWSMLGERPVEVLAWENFSREWLTDIQHHLNLKPIAHEVDYGHLPDLSKVNSDNDIVFVWNGTTSGVRLPHTDWINSNRQGLTFCDATSAVFAYDMDWSKLDVVTWSWQKALGSEAAHGMIALSPRAVERLETYAPDRALPKIFRMTKNGKLNAGLFDGLTINTPSMMVVEDCLDALNWVTEIGGIQATIKRATDNLQVVMDWVAQEDWIDFLPEDPDTYSTTSICLKLTEDWFNDKDLDTQMTLVKDMCALLEHEQAGYDIKHYVNAPPGFRIWGGATVESADVKLLLPWIKWAYLEIKQHDLG